MKNYGLPYQGSKQKIIDFIISNLPPARHLYDLFGGGGSVTCAALASGNYRLVHFNDINKHTMFLKDCINDTVPGLFRWVSRSEYFLSRDFDDMAFFVIRSVAMGRIIFIVRKWKPTNRRCIMLGFLRIAACWMQWASRQQTVSRYSLSVTA